MPYHVIEDARLIRDGDNAGLFDIDGEELWIPWGQINEFTGDEETPGCLTMTEWIAQQKGLL